MQLQKHSADKNPCNGQRDRKTCQNGCRRDGRRFFGNDN